MLADYVAFSKKKQHLLMQDISNILKSEHQFSCKIPCAVSIHSYFHTSGLRFHESNSKAV